MEWIANETPVTAYAAKKKCKIYVKCVVRL